MAILAIVYYRLNLTGNYQLVNIPVLPQRHTGSISHARTPHPLTHTHDARDLEIALTLSFIPSMIPGNNTHFSRRLTLQVALAHSLTHSRRLTHEDSLTHSLTLSRRLTDEDLLTKTHSLTHPPTHALTHSHARDLEISLTLSLDDNTHFPRRLPDEEDSLSKSHSLAHSLSHLHTHSLRKTH